MEKKIKKTSHIVIFPWTNFVTGIGYYLISSKPRCSGSIILNVDDSKDIHIQLTSLSYLQQQIFILY